MSTPDDKAIERDGPEQVVLAWPARVKLLNNRHVWSMVTMGFGAGGVVLAAIFALASGEWGAALLMGTGGFAFFMAVFVVIGVVVDLGGGFPVTFSLTSRGVHSTRGKRGRAVPGIAVAAGVLAGSAAAIGAGIGADAERDVFIPYPDVRKVAVSATRCYILVRGGFGDKPIGLYCEAELSPRVIETLRKRCPSAVFDFV